MRPALSTRRWTGSPVRESGLLQLTRILCMDRVDRMSKAALHGLFGPVLLSWRDVVAGSPPREILS